MSPFDSGCPHGNESPAYCKSCQDYEHAQLRKVATPSRARPSDRAIAAAFWTLCGRNYSGDSSHVFADDVQRYAKQLDTMPADTEPRAVDGDARSMSVYRFEDMSQSGRLLLFAQEDGDVVVTVADATGTMASVEFCSSGGRSPRTLAALRSLTEAMMSDCVVGTHRLAAQRNEGDV